VTGVFLKKGAAMGGFTGKDPHMLGDNIVFIQKFDKMPGGALWVDGATITMRVGPQNRMTYIWRVGKSSGTRTLEPMK